MKGEYKRFMNDLVRTARKQGWTATKGKHMKFRGPEGQMVSCSLTPTSSYFTPKNILGDLRRAGMKV